MVFASRFLNFRLLCSLGPLAAPLRLSIRLSFLTDGFVSPPSFYAVLGLVH